MSPGCRQFAFAIVQCPLIFLDFLKKFKNFQIIQKFLIFFTLFSAEIDGSIIPGHFSLDNGHIWVAVNGEEQAIESFEFLVNSDDYEWVQAANGEVPPNAVPCGNSDGETLFLAKCEHEDGIVMAGYVQKSQGKMFMPFDSTVFEKMIYDVLVKK